MLPLLSTPSDTRIYGVVGDRLEPIVDVLRLNGNAKWIHVRHKETIAFVGRRRGSIEPDLAVCGRSCGAGNPHLINGPFDANRSNAPILAIASLILGSKIGTGYFQETRWMGLAVVANCLRVGSTRREGSI
jgi:pyruvate dehydrogenase (quinone)